jgi:adenylate cyclase
MTDAPVPSLDVLRPCFEGFVPSMVATCAPDGTPNVTYVSQVHYVDAEHVALTYQFFSKTRENVLANPFATVLLVDPGTGAQYRLAATYLRTETAGPLFESMKAKLAGIASHTGMTGVFRLLGSDVYRVDAVEPVPGPSPLPPEPRRNALAAVRATCERLSGCQELDRLLDEALACVERCFDIRHSMVLMLDAARRSLFIVATRGYATSGIGSEIPIGRGVIGVAARECTPIRISHATAEYGYGRALRESAAQGGLAGLLDTEIAFPGLAEPGSQLAVPIVVCRAMIGVLYVESGEARRFSYDDEDALVAVAAQLGTTIALLQATESHEEQAATAVPRAAPSGAPLVVRHFAVNDCVFLGDEYLIKGVAGAIFWKLARDCVRNGRTDFTNRELRLDPSLRLPEVSDNLEARLVLLQRRLAERGAGVAIEKTGRGRFRLAVKRPLQLQEVAGGD